MTSNKNKQDRDNLVSLHGKSSSFEGTPINSPEAFMRLASSLVAFEKGSDTSSHDTGKPAPRVASLEQFAGKGTSLQVQGTKSKVDTDESSAAVTPFPSRKDKPPSPGTT